MKINDGIYKAVASNGTAQFGMTSKGTEQVLVNAEIIDGECAGRTVPWFGFFSEKTIDRTIESLRYFGWKGNDLANIGVLDQVVEIVVENETNNEGKVYPRVRWVNRPGGGGLTLQTQLEGGQLAAFAARMKAKAAGIPAVEGERRQPGSASVSNGARDYSFEGPPAHTDDDLPF